ncbi:MAG: hypothetical protein ACI9EF_000192 [Pseudohongiellaceae bacterium]|jgi:hypothetical protein
MLSRFWLRGRRRQGRRDDEQEHIYVDRYTFREWGPALALVLLSATDLVLTLLYIEQGGEEANPVMRLAIEAGIPVFVTVKLGLTALGALFLLIHSRFGWIRWVPWTLLSLYAALMGYHVWLRIQLP